MSENKLNEFLFDAVDSDSESMLNRILSELKNVSFPLNQEIKDGLSMIIESWQLNPEACPNKANFIIELAQFFNEDYQELRLAMASAVRKVLPTEFNKTVVIRAIGIRDENVSLSQSYWYFKKIVNLKSEVVVYHLESHKWSKLEKIDWITGSIVIHSLKGTDIRDLKLEVLLKEFNFFFPSEEINHLLTNTIVLPAVECKKILSAATISLLTDDMIKKILFFLYVPNYMTMQIFENWWGTEQEDNTGSIQKNISIENSRSIQELHQFLIDHNKINGFSDKEFTNIVKVLGLIRQNSGVENFILWTELLCVVYEKFGKDNINLILPENEKILQQIWPDSFNTKDDNAIWINLWIQLKTSLLPIWAEITKRVKGTTYLVDICINLPWKAWNAVVSQLDTEKLIEKINTMNRLTNPEVLLWIWKNRQNPILSEKINYHNLFTAMMVNRSGNVWETATKELKKLLLENTEFQNTIIKTNDENNLLAFLKKLNYTNALSLNEKQSLIVKLSRKFPILKQLFEGGKAQSCSMFNSEGRHNQDKKKEVFITSQKSYNEKMLELKDLINKQIPENKEAIATARAHGDLRENAEYAAAKDRQKFLNGRRLMLETRIAATTPMNFSDIKISNKIVAGCTVEIKHDDNSVDIFHVLGAWDSDPAKKYVSYETALGKVLVGKTLGDEVVIPGDVKCKITKIYPLSEEILKDLV